jgi:hypothetical protein
MLYLASRGERRNYMSGSNAVADVDGSRLGYRSLLQAEKPAEHRVRTALRKVDRQKKAVEGEAGEEAESVLKYLLLVENQLKRKLPEQRTARVSAGYNE